MFCSPQLLYGMKVYSNLIIIIIIIIASAAEIMIVRTSYMHWACRIPLVNDTSATEAEKTLSLKMSPFQGTVSYNVRILSQSVRSFIPKIVYAFNSSGFFLWRSIGINESNETNYLTPLGDSIHLPPTAVPYIGYIVNEWKLCTFEELPYSGILRRIILFAWKGSLFMRLSLGLN